jgi:hypothetical protein
MPRITNKAFDQLLLTLEQLVTGGKKHQHQKKIAALLDTDELSSTKDDLVQLRLEYIQKELEARRAYEQFRHQFVHAQRKTSNDCRILKGILGPKSPTLIDFGLVPDKEKATRLQRALKLEKDLLNEHKLLSPP